MTVRNKVRVGVTTRPIQQGRSGSGRFLRSLINEIRNSETFSRKIEIIEIPDPSVEMGINHSLFWRFRKLKKGEKDLIEEMNPDLLLLAPFTLKSPWNIRGMKKIGIIHGVPHVSAPAVLSWKRRWHDRVIVPWLIKSCDHFLTVTDSSKKEIIDAYPVSASAVTVVKNGINKSFRDGQAFDPSGRDCVLHVSNYSIRKNPVGLLNGFSEFLKNYHAARLGHEAPVLHIVGHGWENSAVLGQIKSLGIAESVAIHGYVSDSELSDLYSRARVFIFPSFYEGFGIPNLEALSHGVPVVTTSTPQMREVLGGFAWFIEDPRDHKEVGMVLEDAFISEISQRHCEMRRLHVTNFDFHEEVQKFVLVCEMLVNNR